MADTKRAWAEIADLLKSGLIKNISAQDLRDAILSVFGDVGYGTADHTTAAELKDAVDKKHAESHNAASHSDITSSGANIDDAVSKKHTQGTDTTLGTQTQDLNMGTHKIIGVVDPVNAQDAATKKYVENPSGPVSEFIFLERTSFNVYAHQGVCTDGEYYYTVGGGIAGVNTILYKFDRNWNLVASRDTASDAPVAKEQINHIFHKDGKLYIGASNYNTTPKESWIVVYNASDLTPDSYHVVKDYWCEGCCFHDGYWWVVYIDYKYVSKYNTAWEWQADYELTYSIADGGESPYYNGIIWIDDYIYVNIHAGSTPVKCDCYHWTGSGFNEVARLDAPTEWCTQGLSLDLDGKTILWAERNYNGVNYDDRVVKALLRR